MGRIINPISFGLTRKDLEKLKEICKREEVASKSEMIRRIIDRSLPEKKEAQDRIFRESQATRYIEIKNQLTTLKDMAVEHRNAIQLINKKFNTLKRQVKMEERLKISRRRLKHGQKRSTGKD